MMIDFNSRGYITPPEAIDVDFDTFKQTFVVNNHRQVIFDEYQTFLASLKNLQIEPFFQWINGSFTTQKPHPNDIDVVTFIDFEAKEQHQDFLNALKSESLPRKIDAYFVATYPENHPQFLNAKADKLDFYHKFVRDWKQERRKGQKLLKGFVQLNFK
jgi:hypothetical protein